MTERAVAEAGKGHPPGLVIIGERDLEYRVERARLTYQPSMSPPLPTARPFIIGKAEMEPLLDQVLGLNHVVQGHYTAGTVSVLHEHDCDQVLVITGGEGEIRTGTETFTLAPGMVVWIPKGEPHVHAASHGSDFEFVYFTATGHSSNPVE